MSTAFIPIRQLIPDELQCWLTSDNQRFAIEVYGSWCIYHLLTKRILERMRLHLAHDVTFGCFEASGHESMLENFGIQQVPSIIYQCPAGRLIWQGATDLEVMLENIAVLEGNS